jgi:transposase
VVDAVEPIKQPRGRPRQRPAKLHADKGYAAPHCRRTLRQRGSQARIARNGIESTVRRGRYRWGVARPLAWLNPCRRLPIRYERGADLQQAFLDLGGALIGLRARAGRF